MRVGAPCFVIVFLTRLVCVGQNLPVEATIRVVDADSSGSIKLTTSEATSRFRLPLEVDGAEVTDLTVTIDDFMAANGSRVRPELTLNGKAPRQPINVTLKDRPIVEFSGSFPVAGEYKSHLVLFYSGKRKNWGLVVVRQKGELAVQIDGLETVTATKWWTTDAIVRFAARETAGQRVVLYPPTLEGIALKEGDKARKQARFERIALDGGPMLTSQQQNLVESYVVEPLSSRNSSFQIFGIKDVGEYTGVVRLSGSNGNPVTKEVTLLVKSSGWVAIFWIFSGVLMSFLIRRYTKEERPKLEALRRLGHAEDALADVVQEAGKTVSAPVQEVFAELGKQLSTVKRCIEERTVSNNGADTLSEMETKLHKLPDWLTTGRRLDAIAPAEIVETPRLEWETVGKSYFFKLGPPADIDPLLADINKGVSKAVTECINQFTQKVEDYKTAHGSAALEIDKKVTPELNQAKASAKPETWQAMTDHFRKARLEFAKTMASEFDAILTGPQPLGFDPKSWSDLRNEIVAKLGVIRHETDPNRVDQIYQEINRTYFDAVISKLQQITDGLAKSPQDATESAQFEGANGSLTSARIAIQKADWDAAKTQYMNAITGLKTVLESRAKKGSTSLGAGMDATAAKFGDTVSLGPAFGSVINMTSIPERQRSTAEWLTEKIDQYDLLLNIALLAIACLVGLGLLWVNDPVWGGWKAYITAVLWGLGLHQVAGSTLDGLPVIAKKLTD